MAQIRLKALLNYLMGSGFNRYVLFGTLNTGITYFTYLVLLSFISYSVAYTVSFIQGIISAYYFYSKYVFKTELAIKQFAKYPFFYIAQYALSMLLLKLFVTDLHFNAAIAPISVIILLVPLSYLMNKFILVE